MTRTRTASVRIIPAPSRSVLVSRRRPIPPHGRPVAFGGTSHKGATAFGSSTLVAVVTSEAVGGAAELAVPFDILV